MRPYIYLLLLFISCNSQQPVREVGTIPQNRLSPSDAIYKFSTLRDSIIEDHIVHSLEQQKIPLDSIKRSCIADWLSKDVFSNKKQGSLQIEWTLNDRDLCMEKRTYFYDQNEIIRDSVSVTICNSALMEDLVVGEWALYLDSENGPESFHLYFDSKIIETVGFVGYHKAIEQQSGTFKESLISDKLKHKVYTDVYFNYQCLSRQVRLDLCQKIARDSAIMYSSAYNLDTTDYINEDAWNKFKEHIQFPSSYVTVDMSMEEN
ncbi:hypothetical protein [Algivirga pacifica]|uniref:Lipoprotein n=1 Tax=Algivirga pacifica TaxID=1162670 RepID=A0ABP9DBB8_9BACT